MASREKTVIHPSATWSETMDLLDKLVSLGGRPSSVDILASAYGLKNPKTKSFQSKLTSARLFGLVTIKGGTVGLTDEGNALARPTQDDITSLKLGLFVRPKLYAELINAYDGRSLPRIDLFENILVREYGISEVSKKRAAQCFISSAEELGILVNGVISYKATLSESEETRDAMSCSQNTSEPLDTLPSVASAACSQWPSVHVGTPAMCISIPISRGDGSIEIKIPKEASLFDLHMAQGMFDVYLKSREREGDMMPDET